MLVRKILLIFNFTNTNVVRWKKNVPTIYTAQA